MSSSSLERDRTTKQRIYAEAGIEQCVIVSLVDQRVEVHEEPEPKAGQYRVVRFASGKEDVTLRVAEAGVEAGASEQLG